jgi:uncharacterized protein (TIGR03435 family)
MYIRYALLGLAMVAETAHAQTKPPSFEVASVKLAPPLDFSAGRGGPQRLGVRIDAGRLDIGSLPLRDVITGAYRLKSYQLEGPEWMKSVMVNIVATLPAGAAEDQIPEMLQILLLERFGLKAHQETRDQPVFALIVGKGGPKMKDAVPSNDPELAAAATTKGPDFGMFSQMSNAKMSGDPMKGMTITGLPQGGTLKMSMTSAGIHLESSTMDMPTLVTQLTQYLDRPVFDETGLKGNYQIGLDLSMEDMMSLMSKNGFAGGGGPPPGRGDFGPNPFAGAGGESSGSSILMSIQRLGLKLDSRKSPMPMLVIDHFGKGSRRKLTRIYKT